MESTNNNNITYSANNVNQSSSYTTHNSTAASFAPSSSSSTSSSQQHQTNNGGRNPYRANPNRFKTNRKPFVSKKPLEQQNNVLSGEEGKVIDSLLDETVRDKEKEPGTGAIEPEFIESSNGGLNSNDIQHNVKDKRRQRHGQMKPLSYQNNNSLGSHSHSHKSNNGGQRNGGGGGDFKKVRTFKFNNKDDEIIFFEYSIVGWSECHQMIFKNGP